MVRVILYGSRYVIFHVGLSKTLSSLARIFIQKNAEYTQPARNTLHCHTAHQKHRTIPSPLPSPVQSSPTHTCKDRNHSCSWTTTKEREEQPGTAGAVTSSPGAASDKNEQKRGWCVDEGAELCSHGRLMST